MLNETKCCAYSFEKLWSFFSPGNHFPKIFQLIYIGISFTGEKISLTAFSNKIAQEIMILGGTCWHSLTVLAQMCDISGSAGKTKGCFNPDFPDSKGRQVLNYFIILCPVICFDMLKNNKSMLHQLPHEKSYFDAQIAFSSEIVQKNCIQIFKRILQVTQLKSDSIFK